MLVKTIQRSGIRNPAEVVTGQNIAADKGQPPHCAMDLLAGSRGRICVTPKSNYREKSFMNT